MRRRATRLWWTRSSSPARRCEPLGEREPDRAHTGRSATGGGAVDRPGGAGDVDQLVAHVVEQEAAGGLGQRAVQDHPRVGIGQDVVHRPPIRSTGVDGSPPERRFFDLRCGDHARDLLCTE